MRWFSVAGLALALLASSLPAQAGRPILDTHKLDAYFALYAHDSNVPWSSSSVRLDTYTSAPVDFSVYQVDPADVIIAGANTQPRAVDTRRLHAIATWHYTPPGGYRFQSNDVDVPLGSREGFFVVEARRGNVGEQVWINRTRIGLLTKETPSGIAVYGTDLASGKPLSHLRVSFVVNSRFADRYTDSHGIVRWRGSSRPIFALAQWGNSIAFVSFLPQAPLPGTIVAVKTGSAVVHAGSTLRVVGFARSRAGSTLRASTGTAEVTLRSAQGEIAHTSVRLDAAGAFAALLAVPASSRAGEYTVMATVNGATSGTTVHVDANAGGLTLSLAPQCQSSCDPDADVPVVIRASRDGLPARGVDVRVDVIRSPHAYEAQPSEAPWGITQWYGGSARTDGTGRAVIAIPHPTDGLSSTYGVRASSGGATADTRIVVPTAPVTLRVQLEHDDLGSGTPAGFDVYANDVATGKPAGGIAVRVQLVHGATSQEQTLQLDSHGRAHGSFSSPEVGSNLVVASATAGDRQAMDATQLQVEAQTMQLQDAESSSDIAITLDRKQYVAGQDVDVDASANGAQGDAVLTFESATGTDIRVVPVSGGHARTSFRVADAPGALAVGAAFVREGALEWSTVPLAVDAPGRPVDAPIVLDHASYNPGAIATLKLGDARPGAGTLVVRVTKGSPSGSALFDSAPDLLAVGITTTQDSAIEGASWHPWVDSTGDHPVIQTFERRTAPPADLAMTQADTASLYWKVDRNAGDAVQVPVPAAPGKYVVSVLKIDDDGRVTAASSDLIVQ